MSRSHAASGSPYEQTIGFSRAVRVGGTIAVSGTAPVWPDGEVDPDVTAQARRCWEIALAALDRARRAPGRRHPDPPVRRGRGRRGRRGGGARRDLRRRSGRPAPWSWWPGCSTRGGGSRWSSTQSSSRSNGAGLSVPSGRMASVAALDRFSEPTRTWFGAAFAEPTPAQDGRVGGDRRAAGTRSSSRPTGSGKTLQRVPVVDRPAADRAAARGQDAALPGALRLAAQGAGRRRRAQPARPADRHPAHRRAARRRRLPEIRVGVRSGDTPAADRRKLTTTPARHPDHHARVAVPDAHLPGPRVAARRRDRHRRRGARRRRHQARRPPRALPRAARRAARPARPAHRPVGHGAPARGGRPVPRRARPGRDRGAAGRRSSGTSRSSSRSRT